MAVPHGPHIAGPLRVNELLLPVICWEPRLGLTQPKLQEAMRQPFRCILLIFSFCRAEQGLLSQSLAGGCA